PPRKKKRTLGTFPCAHCDKVFTRSDHLARHNLNHEPKEVFKCDFVIVEYGGNQRVCGKTFVRKDLRERHMKRHLEAAQAPAPTPIQAPIQAAIHAPVQPPIQAPIQAPIQVPQAQLPTQVHQSPSNYHIRHPTNPTFPAQPPNHYISPIEFARDLSTGSTLPQSQNDILSWLFTESPPNNMVPGKNMRLPLDFPSHQFMSSPYGGSQFSPPNGEVQPGMSQHFRSPDQFPLQDLNIFLNEDNPLDEVFIRNRAQTNFKNPLLDGSSVTTPAGATFPSTASSNSPTESSTSRKASVVGFSPDSIPPVNFEPLESKLATHRLKHNLSNNPHIFVDTLIIDLFFKAVPQLSRSKLVALFDHDELHQNYTIEDRLSYYLSIYWLVFHKQFTFLHAPSFDTKSAPPLLLLAMILIGCNYSSPDQSEHLAKAGKKSPEFKFSMMIAVPLRYCIFEHEHFQSPVKLWVLQSLVLLEWCEKNFLLRRMHERAHVHHGTTVQLLRRSPLLGGNPSAPKKNSTSASGSATLAGEDDSDTVTKELAAKKDTSDYDLFVKWVEAESMKRITFMTFYLDTIDYIKFRHNPQITIYQLQLLSLPSDDDQLWESKDVNGSFRKIVKRQKKLQAQMENKKRSKIRHGTSFLNVLKKLLKSSQASEPTNSSNLSSFTRKILLAGLVSIMYHLQQADDQNSSSLLSSNGISNGQRSKMWKETLSKAFDNWNTEILQSYTQPYLSPVNLSIFNDINTSQVPIPMYHLSQVIGMSDINHFDIAIYGGSPANQSVEATIKDQYIVQRKLTSMWPKFSPQHKRTANELINFKSVIHCYMLLWQLMLKPLDDGLDSNFQYLEWNVNHDFFDSMYAVSICTLVLWCYSYSTLGNESNRFNEIQEDELHTRTYDNLVQFSAEGGYQYLARVKQEFLTQLRKDNLHKQCIIYPFKPNQERTFSPHEALTKYCDILPHITNKQNMSGLCFLVGTKLLNSQWEVIRENAKLILNCGYRSIGKKEVVCQDLF
ncbi:uncharacterized protein CANTADRAFT_34327, partial [Suhomyces tanzawaensis NRRL Y-17324]